MGTSKRPASDSRKPSVLFRKVSRPGRPPTTNLYAAASLFQLGKICFLLQELPNAERYLQQSLYDYHERLGLKEVEADYIILAEIARAPRRHCPSRRARERKERHTPGGVSRSRARGERRLFPAQFAQAVQQISRICAQAGFGQEACRSASIPTSSSALAAFERLPAPFPDLGAFLRRIAAGELIPPPSTLPAELRRFSPATPRGRP